MTGTGRTAPSTIADVAPGGQLLDQLNQQQIDKIRQPLFSVDLINAVASSAVQGGAFRVQLQGNNPSQSLHRMKVWYPAGDPVVHLLENADALIAAGVRRPPSSGHGTSWRTERRRSSTTFRTDASSPPPTSASPSSRSMGPPPSLFPTRSRSSSSSTTGRHRRPDSIRSRAPQARRIPTPFSASSELRLRPAGGYAARAAGLRGA